MNPVLALRAILLDSPTSQGVVLKLHGSALATVSTPRGPRRVPVDLPVALHDVVTLRAGRVVAKRTGGAGGAIKVYYV